MISNHIVLSKVNLKRLLKLKKSGSRNNLSFIREFILETNYPSETDNSSKYKFGAKTNYGAKFV